MNTASKPAVVEPAVLPPATLEVSFVRLDPDLPVPTYQHPGDAGLDLHAREDVTIAPGCRAIVGTGIAVGLAPGYAAFVHPRSGLAAQKGVTVLNAPGTVDAGYRGEVKVILINTDLADTAYIKRGDRIAQAVIQKVEHVELREVAELDHTARGAGRHGSTGGFQN